MTNTKKRHLEILAAAKELLADIDVTQDYDFLPIAKELVAKTGCHITTAKGNLAQAARLKRGEIIKDNWGGER